MKLIWVMQSRNIANMGAQSRDLANVGRIKSRNIKCARTIQTFSSTWLQKNNMHLI